MPCTADFVEFVCDALAPLGEVRSRKMMGDYVIYLNDKCVITACDNMAFVKKLPCIADFMAMRNAVVLMREQKKHISLTSKTDKRF